MSCGGNVITRVAAAYVFRLPGMDCWRLAHLPHTTFTTFALILTAKRSVSVK
jgi:hypothetical protein